MFVVIDTRTKGIRWSGTKKECLEWIKNCNPENKKYYEIKKTKSCQRLLVIVESMKEDLIFLSIFIVVIVLLLTIILIFVK